MQIFFESNKKPPSWNYPIYSDNELVDPWFYIAHHTDGRENDDDVTRCLKSGGAVLFVSGSPLEQGSPERNTHYLDGCHTAESAFDDLKPFLDAHVKDARDWRYLDWDLLYGQVEASSTDQLCDLSADAGADFFIYSKSLSELWRLSELKNRMVIVWNGTPHRDLPPIGHVSLASAVTPYDWAVAMELQDRNPRKLKVILADLARGRYSLSIGVRIFRRFPELLPWLKVCDTLDVAKEALVDDTTSPRLEPTAKEKYELHSLLRLIWAGELTRSESRHSIANVAGPRLLLHAMGKPQEPSPLDRLLETVGLMPQAEQSLHGTWWTAELEGVDEVLLIDDLAEYGWEEFLKAALGPATPVLTEKNVSKLIGKESDFWNRKLVLLDLRLFPREDAAQERRFYEQLVTVLKNVLRTKPWLKDEYLESDVIAVDRYCREDLWEKEEHHKALSLLPRVLAATNPRLPIMTFSSTGRKEIAERLNPYANIVNIFTKPQFTGEFDSGVVAETKQLFEDAMTHAARIAHGREELRLLERAPEAPKAPAGKLIEILLDESGDPTRSGVFVVGGLVLAYKETKDAGRLIEQMQKPSKGKRLVFGHAENFNLIDKAIWVDKWIEDPKAYNTSLEELKTLMVEGFGIDVRSVALARKLDTPLKAGLIGETSEKLYRGLLSELLEGILFDLVTGDGRPEIRIHVATRVFKVEKHEAVKFERQFRVGSKVIEKELKCFSLSSNEVHPIVNDCLLRRNEIERNVQWARGARLSTPAIPITEKTPFNDNLRPTQIHYLADWIARFARLKLDGKPIPTIADEWFSRGFLALREDYKGWLHAARAGDGGDYALGFEIASTQMPDARSDGYSRWVRPRIARWVQQHGDARFGDFCDRLANRKQDRDSYIQAAVRR